jgi:DNA replication protein DnaC
MIMHPTDELVPILKRLRLSGVLETLDIRQKQAVEDNLSHPEFLYRLLNDEVERRESKQLELRLRRASFEYAKTLEDFEFQFNPKVPKAKIIELATCAFIARHENVALIGPAGVGKSHIAQAIGHRACRVGHSVLYLIANKLFSELRAARADESYEKKLLRFTTPELLIVDDLGLRPLANDEPMLLHEIIRQRYERGSLIITSNRAIQEWYPLFRDDLLASAALDRFMHHAHVIVMEGRSYRNPSRAGMGIISTDNKKAGEA